MGTIKVKKAPPLEAEVFVPGDKSISHRAVMLAALSNGPCVITRFLPSADCMATVQAMQALGVEIEQPEKTTLIVHGCKGEFQQPQAPIDCGNSGTTMRLLSGILAAQPFTSTLVGDESLSKRPMKRIIEPLSQMGATIESDTGTAPLTIRGSELSPITYHSPIASAQVKSAILLAGLFTKGKTTVVEPAKSRDHTERMLSYFLVTLAVERSLNQEDKTQTVSLHGTQYLESRDFEVPGDISSAAFWMVAAAANPGARVQVRDVGLNDTRTGILSILVRMGARVREVIEEVGQIERIGTVEIHGDQLKGTTISGEEIPQLIDEIPILAVAGALAEGTTTIRDAAELRVKETDRIAAVANNLRAMGVTVDEFDDGMTIHGGSKLNGATLPSYGDHRIAMSFAIAGLFADGETVIEDTDCITTSYPGFEEALKLVIKPIDSETTPVVSTFDTKSKKKKN